MIEEWHRDAITGSPGRASVAETVVLIIKRGAAPDAGVRSSIAIAGEIDA